MGLREITSAEAVRRAAAEFDEIGEHAFLAKYGFDQAREYMVVVDGRTYPSKAILGAAHGFQFPDRGPLSPTELHAGQPTTSKLQELGFEIQRLSSDPWDAFLTRLAELFRWPDFDAEERVYKLEIAERLTDILHIARDGGDYREGLKTAFRARYDQQKAPYNLTNWRQNDWLLEWARRDDARVRDALASFLSQDLDVRARFVQFSAAADEGEEAGLLTRNRAGVIAFGSLFNFAISPLEFPLIRSRVFSQTQRAVGVRVPRDASAGDEYAHHLRFAEEVRTRLIDAGVEVRDMLDVQSLLFLYSWEESQASVTSTNGEAGRELDRPIHLVVKWSERFGPNTIEEHRAIVDEHGETWWGLLGSPDRTRLAAKWLDRLRGQLDADTPTKVHISGPDSVKCLCRRAT